MVRLQTKQHQQHQIRSTHISVDAASVAEGGVLTYTVTLKDNSGNVVTVPAGSSVAVAVNWSGVATAGVDTSALPSSVTISGGTSSTNFTVTSDR